MNHLSSPFSQGIKCFIEWTSMNVMGMVNPKRFEKKAQSIKSTYHWILVMFSLNPRIPLVSFVSKTCWLLRYIQLNFKYPYSITVSWELRDSLHAYAILFTYTWCNIVTCPLRSLVVERRTAERATGVRFPTCVPLARIQNHYGIPTGPFGSCPISIWRPGVLGLSSPGT